MSTFELHHGDAREVLAAMPDNCIDAIVTDPPAGIAFMGKAWDEPGTFVERRSRPRGFDAVGGNHHPTSSADKARTLRSEGARFRARMTPIFIEALRVAKPGAHALVWAIPRTQHWTATALEDAGWEIRDCISHIFGTGFPKSLNAGEGRGTALKPAHEVWLLCRKPLVGTVAANVLAHGTGALNIDACRVGFASGTGRFPPNLLLSHSEGCNRTGAKRVKSNGHGGTGSRPAGFGNVGAENGSSEPSGPEYRDAEGREEVESWACVEGCPVADLDAQSGITKSGAMKAGQPRVATYGAGGYAGGWTAPATTSPINASEGGASRFFPIFGYHPKASTADRNFGLDDFPVLSGGAATDRQDDSPGTQSPRAGAGRSGGSKNPHPTVKNTDLMRWLCRLITPPRGTVLDCFAGSGSTGVAALREGFRFIGIEQDAQYVAVAQSRLSAEAATPKQGGLFA